MRAAPIPRWPPSCSSKFEARPIRWFRATPSRSLFRIPSTPMGFQSDPLTFHITGVKPSSRQCGAPPAVAPQREAEKSHLHPCYILQQRIAIRQLLPYPPHWRRRKLRMAHRVISYQMPRRSHRPHDLRPLPRKVPHHKKGRPHVVPRQHLQQQRSSSIVWSIVKRQRHIAWIVPATRVRPNNCEVGHMEAYKRPPAANPTAAPATAPPTTPGTYFFPASFSSANTSSACPAGVTFSNTCSSFCPSPLSGPIRYVVRATPVTGLPYIVLFTSRP